VRVTALTYPEGSESLYILLEYCGQERLAMEAGTPLILSARTILHLTARAAAPATPTDNQTLCVYIERGLFPVTRSELISLSESTTAAVIVVTTQRTIMGRLDFDDLAPIRRFVQQNLKPQRAT
jgi:hypothetical protein